MIPSSSKFFYALGAVLFVTAVVYGYTTGGGEVGPLSLGYKGPVGDVLGYSMLLGGAGVALFIGFATTAFREADPEVGAEMLGTETAPAPTAPGSSYWPVVGAFGLALVVVGVALNSAFFVAGLILLGAVALEWTMQAWSERATGDPAVNREIRNRMMNPIEVPVAGFAAIAIVILGFSRLFLAISKEGAVWAARRRPRLRGRHRPQHPVPPAHRPRRRSARRGGRRHHRHRHRLGRGRPARLRAPRRRALRGRRGALRGRGPRGGRQLMSEFVTRLLGSAKARLVGLVVLAGLVASACASGAQQTTLEPEGPAADKINDLSNITFAIAGVVFLIVEVGILFIVWKFRQRKDDTEADVPTQTHGNTKAEVGWTLLPAVILAFLAVATVGTILDLADEPEDALRIRVVGQQWWWSYDYDIDGDGVLPDDDVIAPGIEAPEEYETDIVTANEMVIPVGTPVYLDIESRDVIHSYWIPALNGKKDAVPGRTHHLTLEADEPGTYVGQCTEYCGLSHAYMRMSVIALPQDEYDAWVEHQLEDAAEPTSELAQEGLELFENLCASCHLIEGVNTDTYDGANQTSGAAPNLTHFASRGIYAGGIFELYEDLDDDGIIEADEIGEVFEPNQLEAWLRNAPEEKYMAPDDNRGMPNLGLTEAQIDSLVAYLAELE